MYFADQFTYDFGFVYDKEADIKCAWYYEAGTPEISYDEKTWLVEGQDYTVTKPDEMDTGGRLTLLHALPVNAQKLLIRRETPFTQEVGLKNGERMVARTLEGMADKNTMESQELKDQYVSKDEYQELKKQTAEAFEDLTDRIDDWKQDKRPDGENTLMDDEVNYIRDKYIDPGFVKSVENRQADANRNVDVVTYLTQAQFDALPNPKQQGIYCITDSDEYIQIGQTIEDHIAVHNGNVYAHPAIRETVAEVRAIAESALFPTDVVDNLTDGGSSVPLSAEQGKTLKGMISTLSVASYARGVVRNAFTSQFDTYTLISVEIQEQGSGYHEGDALFLNGGGDLFIPATVIVEAINTNGGVTQITIGNPGSFIDNPSGTGLILPGGHGTGAVFAVNAAQRPSSTMNSLTNPKVNDSVTVLQDETHNGETWQWNYADYNEDGIANWVPNHRIDSELRDFTVDPIVADELAGNAVTDAKIGTRALIDQSPDSSLIPIAAKTLTPWLQGIRNNLKHVFEAGLFKTTSGFNWALSDVYNGISPPTFRNIGYGNGRFVSVPDEFQVPFFSDDGVNWDGIFVLDDQDGVWDAVAWGNGRFVVVGPHKSMVSDDGISWYFSGTGLSDTEWSEITFGNGRFVALAYNTNKAAYSDDGITWTETTLPSSAYWRGITYGNGRFVAVSQSNTAAYSDDGGETWTAANTPHDVYSVIFGNGRFVGIAAGPTSIYSDDGITWTLTDMPSNAEWRAVTFGNGRFVAVCYNSNKAAYSADGVTWAETTLPTEAEWSNIIYGDGRFVALALDGKIAYTTAEYIKTDGSSGYPTKQDVGLGNVDNTSDINKPVSTAQEQRINIAVQTVLYEQDATNVLQAVNKLFYFSQIDQHVRNNLKYIFEKALFKQGSGDTEWTVVDTPYGFESIAYGAGKFVAVYGDTSTWGYSTDGINWTAITPAPFQARSIFYGGGKFIAVRGHGLAIQAGYSYDGINWTLTTLPSSQWWMRICYGNGTFITNTELSCALAYSTDGGETWSQTGLPGTTYGYRGLAWGNGKFVAVKDSENIIAYSANGINWTAVTLQGQWRAVAHDGSKFVALSNDPQGTHTEVAYSYDGINWTIAPEANLSPGYWHYLIYADGRFVALEYNRCMFAYSYDGINWIETAMPTSNGWLSIAFGNGRFVAVSTDYFNKVAYSNIPPFYKVDGTSGYPTAAQVGLGNVDNTADADKPVSTAQQDAINQAWGVEAETRAIADGWLQMQIDLGHGEGGAITAHDFGTATPTQAQLIEYSCTAIWGEGGEFVFDADNPANSTYTLYEMVIHHASEIFKNTWVRNTYNNENHKWVLTNTPDTDPPVYIWTDVGQDVVTNATDTYAGVAKLYNDPAGDNLDGSVTQAAIAAMYAAIADALAARLIKSGGAMTGLLSAMSNPTTAAQVRNITVSTTPLTEGTSDLPTGEVYICYE